MVGPYAGVGFCSPAFDVHFARPGLAPRVSSYPGPLRVCALVLMRTACVTGGYSGMG